jgi:hypothetical protein
MNKKDQQAIDELRAYLESRDEKSNTQSDKKIIANANPVKREVARQRTNEQFATEEARLKHSEISKRVSQRPEYKEKQEQSKESKRLKSSKTHTELNSSDEYRKFKSECIKKALQDPIKHKNLLDGVKTREANGWAEKNYQATQNPTTRAKRAASLRNQSDESIERRRNAVQKPIMTPAGMFPSKKIAGEYYLADGLVNAYKKISRYMIDDPKNWYYITKEEYIKLTGKDL